VKKVVESALSS